MNYYDALKRACECAGVSLAGVGRALGHAPGYVTSAVARGSVPRVDSAAAMLAVCNYKLCAVPADAVPAGALVIDAPDVDAGDVERARLERRRAELARKLAEVDKELGD